MPSTRFGSCSLVIDPGLAKASALSQDCGGVRVCNLRQLPPSMQNSPTRVIRRFRARILVQRVTSVVIHVPPDRATFAPSPNGPLRNPQNLSHFALRQKSRRPQPIATRLEAIALQDANDHVSREGLIRAGRKAPFIQHVGD